MFRTAKGTRLPGPLHRCAFVDSGINPNSEHADASGNTRIIYNQSVVGNELTAVLDPYGQGTYIAGLIEGNGATSNTTVT